VILKAGDGVDPYDFDMTCTLTRDGKVYYEGAVHTSKLHRKLEMLIEFLTRANSVPVGTVLLTGTGIIVPHEAALAPGDTVSIRVPEIGELWNKTAVVG
jgi:2-dehydro-3-deoxy-D-arabinonate dehydratase